MRIETVDIIQDLVANINLKLKIDSVVVQSVGVYLVTTCYTLYFQNKATLIIGANTYIIQSVINNTSLVIKGSVTPVVGTYNLPSPFFFHGTIMQTNTELTPINDAEKKTPMVYLKRPFKERYFAKDQALDRESDITLFFLTQSNFEEWKTSDHDLNAIKPMRNLAYYFLESLNKNSQIGKIDSYEMTDRIKFGVVIDKGVSKGYWNDKLSGVELNISLPINKNYKCSC